MMMYWIATLVFITERVLARGPPLADVNMNGSIVFTLSDSNFENTFQVLIPADPDLHSFDENGFLRYRNATVPVSQDSVSAGLMASYEDGKIWSSSSRNRHLTELNVKGPRYRVIRDGISWIFNLAYDSVTKVLYWSQRKYGKLGVIETAGTKFAFAILREYDVVDPHGLAVHITKRKLYVVLLNLNRGGLSETKIMRYDLDGGNPTTILSYPNALIVQDITVDYATDRLFFTDYSLSSASTAVFSCDLDGRNKRQIFAKPGTGLWGVAVTNGYIYATNTQNSTPGEYFLHVKSVDGGEVKNLKVNFQPRWITAYSPEEPQASLVPNECLNNTCEQVCVASSNVGYSCKCSDGYDLVDEHKCEAPTLDDNYLMVGDLGHNELMKLPIRTTNTSSIKAVAGATKGLSSARIYAFAIDHKNGGLIFYKEDFGDEEIVWGDKSIPFDQAVNGIVAHCCEDIIYWITSENIYSWDGKSAEYTILPYTFDFYISLGIIDITIDCITKHLYWSEYSSLFEKGSVKRSDLNGNNVEIVLDNLPLFKGLTIDYDAHSLHVAGSQNNMLYSVPLPQEMIRNSSIYSDMNNMTDFSSIRTKELLPQILNIQVVNGEVYLVGDQRIYKFRLGDNPASVEPYGPDIFHSSPHISYYNRTYHQAFIESVCVKPTTSPDLTTFAQEREDCRTLLAKALASSDGYITALHVYITCVVKSLLPDIISGKRSDITIGQLGLPKLQ